MWVRSLFRKDRVKKLIEERTHNEVVDIILINFTKVVEPHGANAEDIDKTESVCRIVFRGLS